MNAMEVFIDIMEVMEVMKAMKVREMSCIRTCNYYLYKVPIN
jgi:hypothetical protein